VGWDANDPHDHADIMELLEETEMIDAFIDIFPEQPPTHQQGALQINLISVSASLLEFIEFAFILDPSASESNHSCIRIDLNLGNLLKCRSLRDIDPTHHQNRILGSTAVKARSKYLEDLNKKQHSHNISTRMRNLYERCKSTNQCSINDRCLYQEIVAKMYFNTKQAKETCKSVGRFSWSQMLASAGLSVQLANKEMRELLQGNAPKVPHALRQSAIAQAKDNQNKCYEVLHTIQERSKDIRETNMEL
jgi:hypothetical protein